MYSSWVNVRVSVIYMFNYLSRKWDGPLILTMLRPQALLLYAVFDIQDIRTCFRRMYPLYWQSTCTHYRPRHRVKARHLFLQNLCLGYVICLEVNLAFFP